MTKNVEEEEVTAAGPVSFATRLQQTTAADGELDCASLMAAFADVYDRWRPLDGANESRRIDWDDDALAEVHDVCYAGTLAAACLVVVDGVPSAARVPSLWARVELARQLLAGTGAVDAACTARIEQFLHARGLSRLLQWLVHPPPAALANATPLDRKRLVVALVMQWAVVTLHPDAAKRLHVAPMLRTLLLTTLLDAWLSYSMHDELDGAAQVCARTLARTTRLWPADAARVLARPDHHASLRALCLRIWNARSTDDAEALALSSLQSVALHVTSDALLVSRRVVVAGGADERDVLADSAAAATATTTTHIDAGVLGSVVRLLEYELRAAPLPCESKLDADDPAVLLKEQLLAGLARWCATTDGDAMTTALASTTSTPVAPLHLLAAASAETRRPRVALLARNILATLSPLAVSVATATLDAARIACRACRTYVSPAAARQRMCGRCHRAVYCSRDCQLAHWKLHKPHCAASPRP